MLLTHSPSSFYLLFSPFISLSLLYRFQIKLNHIIMLSTALSHQINLRRHTRRSCLTFFIFFMSSISESIFVWWLSRQIFPCWHMLLECLPFFNASGGMISPTIFSYLSDIAILSAHKVTGDEVSVSPILQNRSCIVLLLNSGLASLMFLVIDGYDEPSKYWHSLCIVWRTWKSWNLSRINDIGWSFC